MTEQFSPRAYAALLDAFTDLGYRDMRFAQADPDQPHLVLRHDLDMSLQAAEAIAEIEAGRGMQASYFVLLRTEMYNPMSRAGRRSLAIVAELGHEIGLHLDASLYPDDAAALDAAAARECDMLEQATGQAVTTISFHRPAQSLLGLDSRIGGRIHTYMPRYFNAMGYCSDSQGRWRFGPPLEHEAVEAKRALQLLTHPIWWQEPADLSAVERLDRFAAARGELLRDELAANCIPYRNSRTASHREDKNET
jgi:hypothetical protein